jgi:putative two-component system response regulator
MASGEEILEKAKILVVDDDEVTVQLYLAMLRKAGYQKVWSIRNPLEARRLFLEIRPDLVLLDMHMGAMDGMEVMQQLHAEIPEGEYLPVVVVTADVSKEVRLNALLQGAKDFMTKPIEWGEFMLRIRRRLESRFRFIEMQQTIDRLLEARAGKSTEVAGDRSAPSSSEKRGAGAKAQQSAAATAVLGRLDAIAALIDEERYPDARTRLRGTGWRADVELKGIPAEVLERSQQWIDTGYEALSGFHLDAMLALNALLQVRRLIQS